MLNIVILFFPFIGHNLLLIFIKKRKNTIHFPQQYPHVISVGCIVHCKAQPVVVVTVGFLLLQLDRDILAFQFVLFYFQL